MLAQTGPDRPERSRAAWYRGNIHTHTITTDGDSSAADLVRWYRDQKYNFLVLSDHNTLIDVDGLNALNALLEAVAPQGGSSAADIIQRNVDAAGVAGGVPVIRRTTPAEAGGRESKTSGTKC